MTACHYHPLLGAEYYCDDCDTHLCSSCCDESPLKDDASRKQQCFVCGAPVDLLDAGDEVEPFWRRLPEIYKYPLSVSGSIVILLTAIVSTLFANLSLLSLLPLAAITLYGFACLRETALGSLVSPSVEKSFQGSLNPIIYVLIISVLSSISINFIAHYFGPGFGILAAGFFVVTLPAAIMLVAITEKLAPALNPQGWASIVKTTGTSYFVMLLFLVIMSSSGALLASLFRSSSVSFFSVLVQQLIQYYFIIVGYHLLGYLVYQNHRELGFKAITQERDQDHHQIRSEAKRSEAQLEILIKTGSYNEAKSLALKQLTINPSPETSTAWHWDRCFRLMHAGRSKKRLLEFFPSYLVKLDEDDRHSEMADAYLLTKKKAPKLEIKSPELRLQVAQSLFDIGRFKTTVNILNGFHRDTKNPYLVKTALSLISDSYLEIPGMEENEQAYRKMLDLITSKLDGKNTA